MSKERLLPQEAADQVAEMLKEMKEEVVVTLFTKEEDEASEMVEQLFDEIKVLNDKITVEMHSIESDLAKDEEIYSAPAFTIKTKGEMARGIFYGVPAGHEINTLLHEIIDASKASILFDDEVFDELEKLDKPTNIKVFVTVSCPHCAPAAINALRLARANKNITTEIYEVQTNYDIGTKYNVSGVPKIVIDETKELVGNQPIGVVLETILK